MIRHHSVHGARITINSLRSDNVRFRTDESHESEQSYVSEQSSNQDLTEGDEKRLMKKEREENLLSQMQNVTERRRAEDERRRIETDRREQVVSMKAIS